MSVATVIELTHVPGPNRGPEVSFALKGNLSFRVIRDPETDDQALIVTMPESAAVSAAYELVRYHEGNQVRQARTRVKES